jgi:3'-phosphoadenosine 5'-phosphosulfate sulfotransferase (PAPS reductase)/FAD synthetase
MFDPFVITSPTCISFSGGRTSGYMLWRVLQANGGLPLDAKVLFCNTGKEEEATLRFVNECGQRWGVPITWLEYMDSAGVGVVDFDNASRAGEPFEAVIAQRGGVLPNRVARFCSSELKTRTMHRYLRSLGWVEWDTFIGIRADEPRRVAKFRANPHPEGKHEEVHMPLAMSGIGSAAVGTFWRSIGFDLELPNINGKTMHGNCDLCYLKPAHQVFSLIAEKPERAVWWAEQERKAEAVATGNACRFRDDRPSYAEMANYAANQRDAFGHQDEEAIACLCGD